MKQSTNKPVLKTFNLLSLPFSPGIYSLTNLKTGCVYIGESKNIIQRLRAHRSMLERGEHFSQKMQEDANQDGVGIFEVCILVEGPEYENSTIRRAKENEYIQKISPEKQYNQERIKEKNGFYERTHTDEVLQRLSEKRTGIPNTELGRPISIPPFRSRNGTNYTGGVFLSISEASARTGMARRDIRKRLNDPNCPDWRELTEQERESLMNERQQKTHA